MAKEIQAVVYGGSWWMSPRTAFNRLSCSSVITDMENFGPCWPRDLMDIKSKSSDESLDGSMVFQDIRRRPGGGATTMSPDSSFQMMATAFPDSPMTTNPDWNQDLLFRVQEGLNTFSTSGDGGSKAVTTAEHQRFTMDQPQSLNFITSSGDPATFPVSSTSYDYPSSLLETLYDSSPPPPSQHPLYSFESNSNDFHFVQSLPSMCPKQQVSGHLHLTNSIPFWNASTSTLESPSQFLPSSYKEKQRSSNLTIQPHHQEIRDSGSTEKKSSGELPFKRPWLETPSPLPTFKVRKEKLGDRITALQQLVSPFGKTDTASVLHEAIEYIKLLHDQVNILSAPYMKNGLTKQLQQIHDHKVKDTEGPKQDLRSLGLCLVPVSSMFPVAIETTSGFWTPNFEGSFI
ncbi:transcription factor bHLH112-like isoform X2 [Cynara cardunculus var. scolymus]|uniref:BHLH domain-containing protein n=1 Tax=Cynara cardunculus var. scolymus TaxID=59895 RepID=A0A103XU31_CYNCS|nr:transcription factor bHLH112-like isoform X2 [Cynara cardunculus var. scolymus]KVH96932.1 hypothetical protein Ccrd_000975 [Cynara cardunculus var. scolymus]